MQQIFRTKLFKVVSVAFFLVVLIFFIPFETFDSLRGAVNFVFSPLQRVSYSIAMTISGAGDFFSSIGQLKNENKKLLVNNMELIAENSMLRDAERENIILRSQLELLPRDQWNLIGARVIGQDSQGMGNWIEIDRGSEDGVSEGMSVIVSKGILIGRIQHVEPKTSQIVLLTNSQSTINSMVAGNGTKGILKGEYGLGIILDMILQTDSVSIGDNIVTSGIGGEVPRGLFVGTVQEVHETDDRLFQQAIVVSPIQISKLQVVFVLKEHK
ncbi:MAG: Cell shape-determining protein MreC [Candidatus Moranbacteria bacterium GW2011_GWD2_36_12]|nr:MAG: Cell shape-determining protein MreC [Candidatus Moranbacteria bacterium GW2011_GWD2_36_12]KKQ06699.1 MAG: Cell shape-determining protein MreC [Candidatus Moranbacteria bacterium GW2011_GWE2_36_40]